MLEINHTLLATIVSFIVFYFVLRKLVLIPLIEFVDQRRCTVLADRERAEVIASEARALSNEADALIRDARHEAFEKITAARIEASGARRAVVAEAEQHAEGQIDEAERRIHEEAEQVRAGIPTRATDEGRALAERIVKTGAAQ